MGTKNFLIWTIIAVYQASAIVIMSFKIFNNFL